MQTFGRILKQLNRDFKYISWRGFIPNHTHDDVEDIFMGICMYENGEVYSLDGDTYDKGSDIIHYEVDKADKEFTVFHGGKVIRVEEGDEILTVWEDCLYEHRDGELKPKENHTQLVKMALKQLREDCE